MWFELSELIWFDFTYLIGWVEWCIVLDDWVDWRNWGGVSWVDWLGCWVELSCSWVESIWWVCLMWCDVSWVGSIDVCVELIVLIWLIDLLDWLMRLPDLICLGYWFSCCFEFYWCELTWFIWFALVCWVDLIWGDASWCGLIALMWFALIGWTGWFERAIELVAWFDAIDWLYLMLLVDVLIWVVLIWCYLIDLSLRCDVCWCYAIWWMWVDCIYFSDWCDWLIELM